ncbi:MAG: M1 family metallopeptidase [Halieaceae bacterium]|jgi:aminopeptidase N|nr:M1 family metallopeptidase [Halieaceae bacterium]
MTERRRAIVLCRSVADRICARCTRALSVACAALLAAALSWPGVADPYPVNADIDVEHYRFAIELSDDSDRIRVQARIDVRLAGDGSDTVILDLVNRKDGETGMSVESVSVDGRTMNYQHQDDRLAIALSDAILREGRVAIDVDYSGVPETGLIIGDNKHGVRSFFSDNWPNKARHWLATVDHIADKATAEFIVTAPQRLRVVSNGRRLEESSLGGGMKRTHWRQGVPISPWLYVLAASEFAVQHVDDFEHKAIESWVYRQDRDAGFYAFAEPTKDALGFFAAYVGPFEYEKLANIQSNSVGGGMEAASAILYGDDSVSDERPRSRRWQTVIVHEIAHQWFGNSVTEASWDHVWLSEGFATYFTFLYFEHAKGREAFARYMIEARERANEFSAERPDYRLLHDDLRDMKDVTTRQIYDKGAWVLHMLREQIGDANWWHGIRSYYSRYRNGLADSADFQREMESACQCDLAAFFEYWLQSGSTVNLDIAWHHDADAGLLQIDVDRSGHTTGSPPLELELAIYFPGEALPERVSILLDNNGGNVSLQAARKPLSLLPDPGTRLLARWTIAERNPSGLTADPGD